MVSSVWLRHTFRSKRNTNLDTQPRQLFNHWLNWWIRQPSQIRMWPCLTSRQLQPSYGQSSQPHVTGWGVRLGDAKLAQGEDSQSNLPRSTVMPGSTVGKGQEWGENNCQAFLPCPSHCSASFENPVQMALTQTSERMSLSKALAWDGMSGIRGFVQRSFYNVWRKVLQF